MDSIRKAPVAKPAPIRIPAVVAIAARLETAVAACRSLREAAHDESDVKLAFDSLSIAVYDALASFDGIGGKASNQDLADAACETRMDLLLRELVAGIPTVTGGSPEADDSFELNPPRRPFYFPELPAEEDEPADWPSYPDTEFDGFRYETGPTPIEILGLDRAAHERYQPTAQDWAEMADHLDGRLTEEDHIRIHGCA